jgi:hypothetical protein
MLLNTFTRIHFDDLHDTGIYSWEYLYEVTIEVVLSFQELTHPLVRHKEVCQNESIHPQVASSRQVKGSQTKDCVEERSCSYRLGLRRMYIEFLLFFFFFVSRSAKASLYTKPGGAHSRNRRQEPQREVVTRRTICAWKRTRRRRLHPPP